MGPRVRTPFLSLISLFHGPLLTSFQTGFHHGQGTGMMASDSSRLAWASDFIIPGKE